ncbi:unnamed protein product [Dibothriocephalus latus]|uniref:Tyrosine-protein phosphatase domain-containing protein n=1 Tax=Dibothriocephalus latus TaxID=60516 RepID=A0A3P7NPW4_DIBLA|nr:unnamed protein product [Dibothriocephalus latus]
MSPMSFNDFDAHTKLLASDADLLKEFQTLDYFTNQQIDDYKLAALISAATTNLNRYADMTPCKFFTRPIFRSAISEVPQIYINANYVKACGYDALGRAEVASKTTLPEYIATQAPLTHTEADFLYMVHQQRSPVVIMLCKYVRSSSITKR